MAQTNEQEWRCDRCGRLLGLVRGGLLHLRIARGHEYLVAFPATGLCRNCRTLNRATGPPERPAEEPLSHR